ncbi:MAG: hypothetical protein A2504_01840 [Bdellovibrionales bacterium RIFOXYD12_FULL_39_22]|nr:MAG: hypothetical protein A2385_04365 [Bdellovibrionales bacterium RIFOXYB1_FULL_39_21]OFZ42352.1 MAG: hypothetical protein A2485_15130 [Bdellovibrionales bacterium RIFOXYC12_FULL_39_17]OFZ46347.1 MAG: hypothetical protein A2404_13885 [Bdellovibrionales bacterium RIFOXYC1_FULL_39_130]OFZ72808.1 MAG: hypothetical protein A2451_13045 [Bdellovibrionales bacterium RIFOXYC2_FULL_39_8]OFZ75240.1 MAG: hypothetical protein A2560_15940 [Bdellovibrionales bacterium RIFOXYD1_FULL_39_84]OFZ93234.1 MAG:
MALSLDKLTTPKKLSPSKHTLQKDKVLRPWETFDQLGNQTRTVAAKEAVLKAQKIVLKNNAMVEEIKRKYQNSNLCSNLSSELNIKKDLEKEVRNESSSLPIMAESDSIEAITEVICLPKVDYVNNLRDLDKIKRSLPSLEQHTTL